jgi:hypothetical protein
VRRLGFGLAPAWLPVAFAAALSALLGAVAADARWLAALGRYVVRHDSIPDFVPFAAAPSHGWRNVPVLAEFAFHALQAVGGERALLAAQVAAVAFAFTLLLVGARRARASESRLFVVLTLLIPATLAELANVRSQLFSVALFPLLLLVLRDQVRSPSRGVWLVVPLIALWSNLHGAVLAGLAVAAAYLVLERARYEPIVAAGVLAASVLALFATPALWRTGDYYAGVLRNEAARRGIGLWAPISFGNGLDVAFVVCAAFLAVFALRSRPRLWELIALVGLQRFFVTTAVAVRTPDPLTPFTRGTSCGAVRAARSLYVPGRGSFFGGTKAGLEPVEDWAEDGAWLEPHPVTTSDSAATAKTKAPRPRIGTLNPLTASSVAQRTPFSTSFPPLGRDAELLSGYDPSKALVREADDCRAGGVRFEEDRAAAAEPDLLPAYEVSASRRCRHDPLPSASLSWIVVGLRSSSIHGRSQSRRRSTPPLPASEQVTQCYKLSGPLTKRHRGQVTQCYKRLLYHLDGTRTG